MPHLPENHPTPRIRHAKKLGNILITLSAGIEAVGSIVDEIGLNPNLISDGVRAGGVGGIIIGASLLTYDHIRNTDRAAQSAIQDTSFNTHS